jgi:hypothetical protein
MCLNLKVKSKEKKVKKEKKEGNGKKIGKEILIKCIVSYHNIWCIV